VQKCASACDFTLLGHMAAVMVPPRPPQSAYPGVSQGPTSRIQLKPLGGGGGERCSSLSAVTRERKIERGGSLGPTPRSMFEKQDWSMPLEFSSTASKLKEFPSLSKEPLDFRPLKKDTVFSQEKTVVPKPPSSASAKGGSRPSSRLGSAALRSKQNPPGVAESNANHSERSPGTVTFEVLQEVEKEPIVGAVGSGTPQEMPAEPVIGDQTSAVIRQVLPVVQRALASSNPAVFDTTLKVVLRLAKVFGQESIVAHQNALLDGVERRLKETPASAQRAPRVLQMLGDVGGKKTFEEIKRRFPDFAGELVPTITSSCRVNLKQSLHDITK